jgi:poly-beta-hydroxyalkanoate depolymerase
MLYLAYQTQSDIMVPVRAWAAMAVAAGGSSLLAENSATRNLTAAYELIARAGLTHTRPAFGIGSVTVGNRAVEVSEEAATATPFGTLLHFKKHAATAQPRVLVVAPLSGHSPRCCGRPCAPCCRSTMSSSPTGTMPATCR